MTIIDYFVVLLVLAFIMGLAFSLLGSRDCDK